MLICGSGQAKTTGVGDDPALQTGPCYQALVDKNAANPTTAPNRELGSACEAEHGDVEKAWARVIRLWGSDSTDIPDYDSYRRADAPVEGGPPKWLAIAGLLLAYGVLGTPMRSAASLMGSAGRRSSGAAIDVVASLILRAAVAAVLIALFSLPYLAALGGVALTAWILATLRRVAPKSPPAIPEATPGALSRHLAEAINDAGGALAGLAALALFVQHDLILLAVGLALAVVVSAAPVIRARRVLRGSLFGMPAAAALLAAGIGELMIATAPFSGWVGTLAGVTIAAPVALAALTLAVSWRLGVFVKSPVGL
jgi:hypothetical protein